MKIPIQKIFNTADPIRTERDEEELDRLADSMKSDGQIVPIKVRPVGEDYEVVYGNRRLEAARKNGATEIEAIVDDVDDGKLLIHGLIENVVRDDMTPIDTAKALKKLMDETGWSMVEVERRGIIGSRLAGTYSKLLRIPKDIQDLIGKVSSGGEIEDGKISTRLVRRVDETSLQEGIKNNIYKKAAKESLTSEQAAKIARNVAKIPEAEALKYLERPGVAIALEEPEKEDNEPIKRCHNCEGTKIMDNGLICNVCGGKGWLPRGSSQDYFKSIKDRWEDE